MPVDLGVEVLGPLVAAFRDEHPSLRIEFDLSAQAADLFRDPIDIAFRIGNPLDDRVVAREVGKIKSGIYAAPELLRRVTAIETAEQLENVPCLELRTAVGSMAWKVGSRQWNGAPGPWVLAANSVSLLHRLAQEGRGVALLPRHIADPAVIEGRLRQVLPNLPTPTWTVYAVTAKRQVPPQVRLLIRHVKDALMQWNG
jgi:DNA-binding transcriptional LysR family regulator